MTFPTITFKHTNMAPDYTLHERIESKMAALTKYLSGAKNLSVAVELEKLTAHVNGGVCRIEVNVWRGGRLTRAEAIAETFEKAIDEVRSNLELELERAHDKKISVWRRGARRFKMMMKMA